MSALPDPLVPADCDCTDLDGFFLNTERLMASELVALSSHEVVAAALFLWCRAWKQSPAASLPDDDRVMAAFAKLPLARFGKIKSEVLRGFVKCSDGRLYHRILAKEAMAAYERKIAFRKRRETDAARLRNWRSKRGDEAVETPSATRIETRSETRFVAEGKERKGRQTSSVSAGEPAAAMTISPNDLHRRLVDAAQGHIVPGPATEIVKPILDLVAQGCDLERHVLPAIRAVVPNLTKPLGSWGASFLRKEILALKDQDGTRATPSDDPKVRLPGGIVWPESSLIDAIAKWVENPRSWPISVLGFPPFDPSCTVPERYLIGIEPPAKPNGRAA